MNARSKALSDRIWNEGWHPNMHFDSFFPIDKYSTQQLEAKLAALCAGYKAMKKAKYKEALAFIEWKKEWGGGLDPKYKKKHAELVKALKEKYESEKIEWKDGRKEFKLEESLDLDLDLDLDDDLDLDLDLDDDLDLDLDLDGDDKDDKDDGDDLDLDLGLDDDDLDLDLELDDDLDLSLDSDDKDKDKGKDDKANENDLLSVKVETDVVTDNSANEDGDDYAE